MFEIDEIQDRLEEIQDIWNACTGTSWAWEKVDEDEYRICSYYDKELVYVGEIAGEDDAVFVAHAPENIQWMIGAINKLIKMIAELEGVITKTREVGND